MTHTPTLETDRLILRAVTMADALAIQKHFNNFNIIKYIGAVPWPYPDDGAQDFLKRMLPKVANEDVYLWAITLKEGDGELIGCIEYRFTEKADNRGFWLAEPYWNLGIMSEAIIRTQDYILLEVGKEKLIVHHAVSNTGSKRIKEKFGGKLVRIEKGNYHSGDNEQEVWEITRESWLNIRNNYQRSPTNTSRLPT